MNRSARGSTMIVTLVILTVLSLIGVAMSTTLRTDLAITSARQWLSETRENAEQGLVAFVRLAPDELQPGMVRQDYDVENLAGNPAMLNTDTIDITVRELFCGDDGSTGSGNMMGAGAKRVWFNIESTATGDATGTRAQINLGASRLAPPDACNY